MTKSLSKKHKRAVALFMAPHLLLGFFAFLLYNPPKSSYSIVFMGIGIIAFGVLVSYVAIAVKKPKILIYVFIAEILISQIFVALNNT